MSMFKKMATRLKSQLMENRVSMLGSYNQDMIVEKKKEVKDKLKEQYKKRRMF